MKHEERKRARKKRNKERESVIEPHREPAYTREYQWCGEPCCDAMVLDRSVDRDPGWWL